MANSLGQGYPVATGKSDETLDPMQPMQRRTQIASRTALLAPATQSLRAQPDLPNRPLHYIVSVVGGGGCNSVARAVAEHCSRRLGQYIAVDDLGGGVIACLTAARAVPNAKERNFDAWAVVADTLRQPTLDSRNDAAPV